MHLILVYEVFLDYVFIFQFYIKFMYQSYKPSDDSFLLFDAVKMLKTDVVVDVGTGSGFIALGISGNHKLVIGTDIDFYSVREARDNARRKRIYNVEFIVCDLLSAIKDSSVDLIVFNPPYLPSDDYKTDIDRQTLQFYEGGDIIVKFMKDVKRVIKSSGVCYMVFSSLTKIENAMFIARSLFNKIEFVAEKEFFFEKLYVVKFSL
jgi:release factor glutamine methyltransferase